MISILIYSRDALGFMINKNQQKSETGSLPIWIWKTENQRYKVVYSSSFHLGRLSLGSEHSVPSKVVFIITPLAAVTSVYSADPTLLRRCFFVYVDVLKNKQPEHKLYVPRKRHSWKPPLSNMHLKVKTVPVSLDLVFSWSSYQLQCLEDLLFLSFQSIKRREIISGLDMQC